MCIKSSERKKENGAHSNKHWFQQTLTEVRLVIIITKIKSTSPPPSLHPRANSIPNVLHSQFIQSIVGVIKKGLYYYYLLLKLFCIHMGIQCITVYTLFNILNISFFLISTGTKKESSVGGPVWYLLLSLIAWQPDAGFLEDHFPQREMDHSMPMKPLSDVSQGQTAGNQRGPLGLKPNPVETKEITPPQDLIRFLLKNEKF